jgi:hypothetical protein
MGLGAYTFILALFTELNQNLGIFVVLICLIP